MNDQEKGSSGHSPPTLPMLMEKDDNSSALSSLAGVDGDKKEEIDIGSEEGFRVHENTRFRAARRQ